MRVIFTDNAYSNREKDPAKTFARIGHGEKYEQAFEHVYGTSVNKVVSEIVGLFEKRKTHPALRPEGTFFAG